MDWVWIIGLIVVAIGFGIAVGLSASRDNERRFS